MRSSVAAILVTAGPAFAAEGAAPAEETAPADSPSPQPGAESPEEDPAADPKAGEPAAPTETAPAKAPTTGDVPEVAAPQPDNAPPTPSGPPPEDQYAAPAGASTPESSPQRTLKPIPKGEIREPPPPPPVRHRAPLSALWVGVRAGWQLPFGTLWHDGAPVEGLCCFYQQRAFSDYASSGPMFEIDVGARLARRYNVFALWERASLGPGDLDPDAFGGQQRGWTDLVSAGLRFSTSPDDIGFVLELALGYRWFTAYWEDGTELRLRDGLFDARIGLGADFRINEFFGLSPMLTLSSGSFGEAYWAGPRENGNARDRFDAQGQYAALTFQLGGHFDIY